MRPAGAKARIYFQRLSGTSGTRALPFPCILRVFPQACQGTAQICFLGKRGSVSYKTGHVRLTVEQPRPSEAWTGHPPCQTVAESAPLRPSRNDFVDGAIPVIATPLRSAIEVPGAIEYEAASCPAALPQGWIEAVQDRVCPLVALSRRELEDSAATSRPSAVCRSVEIPG